MYDVERVLVLHQTKNALGGAFGSAGCELVYIVSASDVCSAGHYATRSGKNLRGTLGFSSLVCTVQSGGHVSFLRIWPHLSPLVGAQR